MQICIDRSELATICSALSLAANFWEDKAAYWESVGDNTGAKDACVRLAADYRDALERYSQAK